MKLRRTTIPAAALLGLALGAHAQSTVTVSGIVDLSLEKDQTGHGSLMRLSSNQLNQSKLEFSGTEDLGGGTLAVFDLQAPISPDLGTGSSNGLFSRTAMVGLKNARLGMVRAGRLQSISDEVLASFWAVRWGASINYFLYYGNTTQLVSNAVRYETPSWNGLTLTGQYGLSEKSVGNTAELRATYADRKLLVNTAYYISKDHEFSENGARVHIATAGVSYDFGVATPSFVVQNVRTAGATLNRVDRTSAAVSATVPVGTNDVWLDFGILRDHVVPHGDAHAATIRYDWWLSKRTFLYAGAAQVWNDSSTYYQPVGASGSYPVFTSATGVSTGNGGATWNGHDTRSFLVGLRTAF